MPKYKKVAPGSGWHGDSEGHRAAALGQGKIVARLRMKDGSIANVPDERTRQLVYEEYQRRLKAHPPKNLGEQIYQYNIARREIFQKRGLESQLD